MTGTTDVGTLTLDAGKLEASGIVKSNDLTLSNNSTLTHPPTTSTAINRLIVDATNLTVDATSTIDVSVKSLVVIVAALLMLWGLHVLVNRTRIGTAIRAVAEDREMAAIMGVNVRRVIALTFFLGSALGGAAGVLVGLYYTQIDFFMGYSAGLKAFTAAVLGGIGNIRGAMLGGLILGLVESLAVTFMNPAYKDIVAFVVLILVLVFRPTGLLGESVAEGDKV